LGFTIILSSSNSVAAAAVAALYSSKMQKTKSADAVSKGHEAGAKCR
jgi:mevalonate pyrophosphate decarboxylase